MKALLLYFLLFPAIISPPEKYDWTLKKDKGGIKIFSRHSDISKFNDIRVEMDLPGTIAQLSSILIDVEKYPEWAYSTKSCELIKKISANEIIYYSEIWVPWPASNRDFYADCKITLDSASRTLHVASVGLKNYQPEKKDIARIPMSKGIWNVSTLTDKMMHLQYTLQVDPGGSLPAWLLNMFATRGPLETFENLQKKMETLNGY
jgi:START domain-containing protein